MKLTDSNQQGTLRQNNPFPGHGVLSDIELSYSRPMGALWQEIKLYQKIGYSLGCHKFMLSQEGTLSFKINSFQGNGVLSDF